ncbi:MAG: MerR family transcriptional regulator [Acidobacteriaceae bacterium]
MRIGELARRTGVSVRMLRYYEEEQLLRPTRQASGYREYSETEVNVVKRIRCLSEAGLTLATIRVVLPCTNDRELRFQPCKEVRPALEREMRKISGKIRALEDSQEILRNYLAELA